MPRRSAPHRYALQWPREMRAKLQDLLRRAGRNPEICEPPAMGEARRPPSPNPAALSHASFHPLVWLPCVCELRTIYIAFIFLRRSS